MEEGVVGTGLTREVAGEEGDLVMRMIRMKMKMKMKMMRIRIMKMMRMVMMRRRRMPPT